MCATSLSMPKEGGQRSFYEDGFFPDEVDLCSKKEKNGMGGPTKDRFLLILLEDWVFQGEATGSSSRKIQ